MYRNCIFCSTRLGANDAIERFPVGRSLAFDGARGRLWAVCPRCARWNLAPLEERWEAIEEAERIFRNCRLRVHAEHVGIAKLRDGTRLVRVGDALPQEKAVWRYGGLFSRRAWRFDLARSVANTAALIGGSVLPVVGWLATDAIRQQAKGIAGARVMHRLGSERWHGGLLIRRWHLETATLAPDGEGGVEMRFAYGLDRMPHGHAPGRLKARPGALVIGGEQGRTLLAKAVTTVNRSGAHRDTVLDALHLLEGFESHESFVHWVADERMPLSKGGFTRLDRLEDTAVLNRRGALALEIAVHEEHERRALHGELAALQAMWRQAEEIAEIADRLPDDVPASEPPRIP